MSAVNWLTERCSALATTSTRFIATMCSLVRMLPLPGRGRGREVEGAEGFLVLLLAIGAHLFNELLLNALLSRQRSRGSAIVKSRVRQNHCRIEEVLESVTWYHHIHRNMGVLNGVS